MEFLSQKFYFSFILSSSEPFLEVYCVAGAMGATFHLKELRSQLEKQRMRKQANGTMCAGYRGPRITKGVVTARGEWPSATACLRPGLASNAILPKSRGPWMTLRPGQERTRQFWNFV